VINAKKKQPINNNCTKAVAIRVDASTRIGTGHVMRCLTLATKLKKHGVNVIFLSKKHQGSLNQLITLKGFELAELSAPIQNIENQTDEKLWLGCSFQDDANECLEALKSSTINLLIVDHYSLDEHWQKLIRKKLTLTKIMVIDDLANRQHDCDILLDQTLGREASDYQKLVPSDCQLLLGADFIMLRDEFLQKRSQAKSNRKDRINTLDNKNILITMGGTDPDNIAEQLLNWLIKFDKAQQNNNKIQVTLVVNQTSPFIKDLAGICAKYDWITIISNPESMSKLMLNADIAIGSSGATAWERCCLGLPSLAIISAENQHLISDNLSRAGAIINLGHFSNLTYANFAESLSQVLNATKTYQKMVENSFSCCDGSGILKVTNALLAKLTDDVTLQKATYNDCQTLFDWQSNREVRKYFHNPEPVKWQQHCQWLRNTLASSNKCLYIIKQNCSNNHELSSVGVLRLDALQSLTYDIDACWEISIIISPLHQGKKLAERAIIKIPEVFKNQGIIAEVHHDNGASHKLFSRAGFNKISPNAYLLKHKTLSNEEQQGIHNG